MWFAASLNTAIIVAVIVIICFLLGEFLRKIKDLPKRFKGSHDILAGLMLHLTEAKNWPIGVWAWSWVGLALVLGVVLPILLDKDGTNLDWLTSPNGSLGALNYTFLAPYLLWAYLKLLREVNRFFASQNLADLGLSWNSKLEQRRLFQPVMRNRMSNLVLLLVTFTIIVVGVDSSIKNASSVHIDSIIASLKNPQAEKDPLPPWINVDNSTVTVLGCLYYSFVLGLDTYLGLGLTFLAFGLLYVFRYGIEHLGISRFLENDNILENDNKMDFKLKGSIRGLIRRLVWCMVLSPLVATMDVVRLLSYRTPTEDDSWGGAWVILIIWLVVIMIGVIFLIYEMIQLDLMIKKTVAEKMKEKEKELWLLSEKNQHSYSTRLQALININAYVRSGGKLVGVRKSTVVLLLPLFVELLGFIILFFRQSN